MNYKHIIWDWNGTIVDDSWLSVEVLNGILKSFNLPEVGKEDYRENFSFPVINYYRKLGLNVSKEKFDEIGKIFIDSFALMLKVTVFVPEKLPFPVIVIVAVPALILFAYATV